MTGKRFLSVLLLVVIFSPGLPGTAAAEVINQARCYDEAGAEIACAGTGQDGDLQAGTAWPSPRFKDNGDGTITDSLSGLAWLKDAGCLGTANLSDAEAEVNGLNSRAAASTCSEYTANYDDWRLPEVRELEGLTNLNAPRQADWLAHAGFVNVQPAAYWSATPAANAYDGWLVEFGAGAVDYAAKSSAHGVWPVRRAKAAPREQEKAKKASLPRFAANGDGTVSDRETGLIWKTGAHPGLTWQEALALANPSGAAPGKAAGWRLPNRRELQSLIDYRRDYPALPPDASLTGIANSYCWSSSTTAASPAQAWAVHPLFGDTRPLDKTAKAAAWLVRPEAPAGSRLPQTSEWLRTPAAETRLPKEVIGASLPRFTPNPDGTITDNLTGLMWLADADCFGKLSWEEAQEAVRRFDSDKSPFICEGYTGSYRDWLLAGTEQLRQLEPPTKTDPVAWLDGQGFKNVRPQGYWTAGESMANIYYAWLFNLRAGEKRSYPKTMKFHAMPYRTAQ